ncbi:uncharacterized protein LOC111877871 [Lactuca sativa]|uniref:Zinc-finger domain-containing protein n=1 Tax=Lactuca sativa TaxID=4236 RepID=A0A9R1W8F1_LACSA|nr:uncharacterized protein LOC111877871 [Lactuca sativa]KAJ0218247.1 hypothetical protein LSAT_V11C300136120 [Lactuca sativa]
MVTMSDTATQPLDTSTPNTQTMNYCDSTPKLSSDYEKCREQRIKENLERLQKLGIHDLSLKLKSMKPNTNRRNNKPYKTPNRCISPFPSSVPSRRSSRLQNTPIVSYTEVDLSKKAKDDTNVWMEEHKRPEIYTEEHEKLLGDTKMEWTLFVDGYGKDGKKIYDQVRGKTCHQCRQKTLGHRTHCIKCNLVQGQFCGDCLYMRYGENVLEAMRNPDWICPVCRGICNCSLCRQAKGWAPTGVLYRKISSLGYKSVAHYLIQTHRADSNSEKSEKTENSVCAKRSLPFSKEDVEAQKVIEIQSSDESGGKNVKLESGQDVSAHKNPEPEIVSGNGIATNEGIKDKEPPELEFDEGLSPESECTILENTNPEMECKIPETGKDENKNTNSELEYKILEREVDEGEDGNKKTLNKSKDNKTDNEGKIVITPETKPGSRKKRQMVMVENSIAGRLRSRRRCI